MRGQHSFAVGRQPAAEVRTHQMTLAVLGRARGLQHRNAEAGDVGGKEWHVEGLMHRIARTGMGEPNVKERSGGKRCAGPGKADARRSETAQRSPWSLIGKTSRQRDVIRCHDFYAGSSARKCAGRLRGRMRLASSSKP